MEARVRRICHFLEQEAEARPSLVPIAREAGLSVSRACHLFKAETGVTIRRRLQDIRMQRARLLLDTTSMTVKEVAALAGYSTSSHFARAFRKAHGTSPSDVSARRRSGVFRGVG